MSLDFWEIPKYKKQAGDAAVAETKECLERNWSVRRAQHTQGQRRLITPKEVGAYGQLV